MSKPAPSRVAPSIVLGVLLALVVLGYFVLRNTSDTQVSTAPAAVSNQSAAPVAPAADGDLASASEGAPHAAKDSEPATQRAALVAEQEEGGLVWLAHESGDERFRGDGALWFTQMSSSAESTLRRVAIEQGKFEVPTVEPGASWRLEHGVLGTELLLATPVDEVVLESGATRDLVVRLADHATWLLDLRDASTREVLPGAVFSASASDTSVEVPATFDGAVYRLTSPLAARAVSVSVEHYTTKSVAVPSGGRQAPVRVLVTRSGTLEVTLRGVDPALAYDVVVGGQNPFVAPPPPVEVPAGVFETTVELPAPFPVYVSLSQSGSKDVLARAYTTFESARAHVVLDVRTADDKRPGIVVLRSTVEVDQFPVLTVRIEDKLKRAGGSGLTIPAGTSVGSAAAKFTFDAAANRGVLEREVQLAPGIYELFVDEFGGGIQVFVLAPGERHVIEIAAPPRVPVTVRYFKVAGGEPLELRRVGWTDAAPGHRAQGASVARAGDKELQLHVAPSSVLFTVTALEGGRTVASNHGPFDIEGGEELDLVASNPNPLTVALGGLPATKDSLGWIEYVRVLDERGEALDYSLLQLLGAEIPYLLRFDSDARRFFIAPPIHPTLGPLKCGWVEIDEQGNGLFELIPLEAR